MHEKHITAPNPQRPASNTHLYDLQKQGLSANQKRNFYQPYDIKPRNKVNFQIQPTIPQAGIVATGRYEYWITDVDLIKHKETTLNLPQTTQYSQKCTLPQ